jgi:hypothetical protein
VSALALAASGCVVRARGGVFVPAPTAVVVVEEEPPPPRVTYVQPRAGFIWIEGRWIHRGGRYHWHDGHWERERVGYVYAPGRWERRGRGHVWVEGRWRSGGGNRGRNNNRGGGNVTRDHRTH